ncbi:unnamed protein product [Prorocentrum cordatum]|uniref:PDZ GRASP-type domain-containing protein n=1 Tax=Prorocentrum cordatum TaxID=2364126 RepID=A0ABN9WAW7_9DINO|nr:unnamed protein product [Polarella glacialis]
MRRVNFLNEQTVEFRIFDYGIGDIRQRRRIKAKASHLDRLFGATNAFHCALLFDRPMVRHAEMCTQLLASLFGEFEWGKPPLDSDRVLQTHAIAEVMCDDILCTMGNRPLLLFTDPDISEVLRNTTSLSSAHFAKATSKCGSMPSRATSDRDDNIFRLLMCTTKVVIKSATDLRMVSATVYRAAKGKSETPIVETTQATMLNEFFTAHPPKNDILVKRILCFKAQGAWNRKMRKVFIQLYKEIENIESFIMDHLIATGGTEVNAGSPAAEAGLEVFFDFIVEISGVKMAADQSVFFEKIREAEGIGATLVVHNIRTHKSRSVTVYPRKWGGAGLLGAVVRYDSLESTDNQGIRVLDVFENSPAKAAGLIPYKDYLLGTTEVMFRDLDELVEIVNLCLGRSIQIYVYNSDTEQIREASLIPNDKWGGGGAIGADIRSGLLHRIPAPRRPFATTQVSASACQGLSPSGTVHPASPSAPPHSVPATPPPPLGPAAAPPAAAHAHWPPAAPPATPPAAAAAAAAGAAALAGEGPPPAALEAAAAAAAQAVPAEEPASVAAAPARAPPAPAESGLRLPAAAVEQAAAPGSDTAVLVDQASSALAALGPVGGELASPARRPRSAAGRGDGASPARSPAEPRVPPSTPMDSVEAAAWGDAPACPAASAAGVVGAPPEVAHGGRAAEGLPLAPGVIYEVRAAGAGAP